MFSANNSRSKQMITNRQELSENSRYYLAFQKISKDLTAASQRTNLSNTKNPVTNKRTNKHTSNLTTILSHACVMSVINNYAIATVSSVCIIMVLITEIIIAKQSSLLSFLGPSS